MFKKTLFVFIIVFLLKAACFSSVLTENDRFIFCLETYLRNDLVSFENTVDLDNKNSDDSSIYLGIDYSFGFDLKAKENGPEFFLKLERNGPWDYSAPLFIHNTLMTSGERIERYRNDELLPQVEEFWLDTPLPESLGLKIGLYTYEVGNGFSLNGSFENYGLTIYRESENFKWDLYYCRPDLNYKNHLGPRIKQEEEAGIDYEHGAANFFSADLKINKDSWSLEPYVGVLADYTSAGKRDNSFSAPVKKDIFGTAGLAYNIKGNNITWSMEAARNFGKAESQDPAYKDIYHTGYLFYSKIGYEKERFKPNFSFLISSGNKVTLDMAQNGKDTLTSGRNRAFGYISPTNNNLDDSVSGSHTDIRPLVAMGCGYGLNYGVPRPSTFASSDFDNLILPALGFDFDITKKLTLGLYGYYLRSFERGVGMLNSQPKYLSRDLGKEIDLFLDYQLNGNVLISLAGGYFVPGKYYKEERDDKGGSLFSPYVRGDGKADNAYQIELSVELKY